MVDTILLYRLDIITSN